VPGILIIHEGFDFSDRRLTGDQLASHVLSEIMERIQREKRTQSRPGGFGTTLVDMIGYVVLIVQFYGTNYSF
jgi:hypothetical protein